MAAFFQPLVILNAVFFMFYGLQCLVSKTMVTEFRRFGLPDSQRILTGILQLFGSIGLAVGLYFPLLGCLASGGLALMMLVAFGTRIKVGDGFIQSAPSLLFLLINAWLSYSFYMQVRPIDYITAGL
ncbi:MAG TPA: DoxX family protein [Balneolaceae bacterium]|nr:DoxX family protein [Balneolaceae bacterium]